MARMYVFKQMHYATSQHRQGNQQVGIYLRLNHSAEWQLTARRGNYHLTALDVEIQATEAYSVKPVLDKQVITDLIKTNRHNYRSK